VFAEFGRSTTRDRDQRFDHSYNSQSAPAMLQL
jgi:hypothetical protein